MNTAVQVVPGGEDAGLRPRSTHRTRRDLPGQADGSSLSALTHHNDALIAQLDLAQAEGFTFTGADGDTVSGWLVKPPGFDPARKYPVVFLIHGGPQGAWHDEWHARWNYQLFAAPGYAVVAINPRGSTGYGQKFTDQISQDWTGRVYEDLMKGLDHALKTYPFLDESQDGRGGRVVRRVHGQLDRRPLRPLQGPDQPRRRLRPAEHVRHDRGTLVRRVGVRRPPLGNPEALRRPAPQRAVAKFKTPTLVIHGALDFRVPEAQGLGMFTALQRQGVPSRLVFFPDENHWILKPANRIVWWRECHAWLANRISRRELRPPIRIRATARMASHTA